MDQIIVYFDGGLGNQMSQYAMVKLLQSMYPHKRILADISVYKSKSIHNGFELKKIFKNIDLRLSNRLYSYLGRNTKQIIQKYESGYPIDKQIYNMGKDSYRLYGTWHNYDYSSILPALRHDFEFPDLPTELKKLKTFINSTNSVSIHVRKGDYIQYGLNILTFDWYRRAIDIIKDSVPDPVFFVFSDEDVGNDFLNISGQFYFINGNSGLKAYIDMQLMSMCKHNIIANSTFSYWAALLNKNSTKIVIRPAMQTKTNRTWYVKDWILLD